MKFSLFLCVSVVICWLDTRSLAYNGVDISHSSLQEVPNDTQIFFVAENFFSPSSEGFPSFVSKVCSDELDGLLSQCVLGATNVRLNVQYHQWREVKVRLPKDNCVAGFCDPFAYEYEKVWSSELIDSSHFHDKSKINPSRYSYRSNELIANKTASARLPSGEEVVIPLHVLRESEFAWRPLVGEREQMNNFEAAAPSAPFYVDVGSIEKRSNLICYKYGDRECPFWIEIPASQDSKELVLSSESTQMITEAMKTACNGTPEVGATRIYTEVKAPWAIAVQGVAYERPQDIWSQMKTNAKGLLWSEQPGRVIDIEVMKVGEYEANLYLRYRDRLLCRATVVLCVIVFVVITFVTWMAMSRKLKRSQMAVAKVAPGNCDTSNKFLNGNADSDVGYLCQIGGVSADANDVGVVADKVADDNRGSSGNQSISTVVPRDNAGIETNANYSPSTRPEARVKVEKAVEKSRQGAGLCMGSSSYSRNTNATEGGLSREEAPMEASLSATSATDNDATVGDADDSDDDIKFLGIGTQSPTQTLRSPSPSSPVETSRQSPLSNSTISASSSSANPRGKKSRLKPDIGKKNKKRKAHALESTPRDTLNQDSDRQSGDSDVEYKPFSNVSSMDQ